MKTFSSSLLRIGAMGMAVLLFTSSSLKARGDSPAGATFLFDRARVRVPIPSGFIILEADSGRPTLSNTRGSFIGAFKRKGDVREGDKHVDDGFVRAAHARFIGRHELTVDGRTAYEHIYQTVNRRVILLFMGDSTRTSVLEARTPIEGPDTMFAALSLILSQAQWRPDTPPGPDDLDFSVTAREPLTNLLVSDASNVSYTRHDSSATTLIPSIGFSHIMHGVGDTTWANIKEMTTAGLQSDKSFAIGQSVNVESIRIDSLPAAEIVASATETATGRKMTLYAVQAFDVSDVYGIEGLTYEATADDNIKIFREMARSFKRKDSFAALIGRAMDLIQEGRPQAALGKSNRAAAIYPDSDWCYFVRSMSEEALGMFDRCLADADKSLALNHKEYRAQAFRGISEEMLGNMGVADTAYTATVAEQDTADYYDVARFRFSQGKYEEAGRALGKYPATLDEAAVQIWQYFIDRQLRGEAAAQAELKEYFNSDPTLTSRISGEIMRYLTGDMSEDALIQEASAKPYNAAEANFYSGLHHLVTGEIERARECWKKCLTNGTTDMPEYRYAKAHMP